MSRITQASRNTLISRNTMREPEESFKIFENSRWLNQCYSTACGPWSGRKRHERIYPTADRLAQLVEYRTTLREVVGSNPGRTNTQGL